MSRSSVSMSMEPAPAISPLPSINSPSAEVSRTRLVILVGSILWAILASFLISPNCRSVFTCEPTASSRLVSLTGLVSVESWKAFWRSATKTRAARKKRETEPHGQYPGTAINNAGHKKSCTDCCPEGSLLLDRQCPLLCRSRLRSGVKVSGRHDPLS